MRTLTAIVFRIVHILMYLAPLGAFGAMAFTIGQYGIGTLANLAPWSPPSTRPRCCS